MGRCPLHVGGDKGEKMGTLGEQLIVWGRGIPAPGMRLAAVSDSHRLGSSPAAQRTASLSTESFELRWAAAVANSLSLRSALQLLGLETKELITNMTT